MPFVSLWSEVQGDFPRMDQALAQKLTNRAWRLIQDMRMWSFTFLTNLQWFTPMVINAGTIGVTFNSAVVQLDANAQAAVLPFLIGNPPFAGPIGIGYQIRLGSLNTGISTPVGPLYSVLAYNANSAPLLVTLPGVGTLTLQQGQCAIDRPFGEVTVAGAQYLAYKAYYGPPNNPNRNSATPMIGTFFKWTTMLNAAQGYDISGRRLLYTQEQLNRIDPQRGGMQQAYIVAQWGWGEVPGAGQYPVFEMYPHPTGGGGGSTGSSNSQPTTYVGTAICKWGDLGPNQDLPAMPYALSDLVVTRAKVLGCQWALTNAGTFPELAGVNWVAAQQMYDKDFKEQRIQCVKEDDEINPIIPFCQDGKFDFPLGGQFLQAHDISSLVP